MENVIKKLTRIFGGAGLKTKIISAMTSVIILSTLVGSGFLYVNTRTLIFENLEKRGITICKNLSSRARYGLLTADAVALDELAEGTIWTEDLVYVVIRDESGQILTKESAIRIPDTTNLRQKAISGKKCEIKIGKDDYGEVIYHFCTPVIAKKTSLSELGSIETELAKQNKPEFKGTIEIGLSLKGVTNSLRNILKGISVLVLIIIGCGALLSLALAKIIMNPIKEMAHVSAKISAGDRSQTVKVRSHDEIGQFAKQFNQMTRTLIRREEQLQKSNKELEDFAYITSHDLKAPLRGIKTLAEWIVTDYADKLDDDGKEQLELLLTRVDRMHNLIEGILLYSRTSRMSEEMIAVDLNELLPEIIDMISAPENITITVKDKLPMIKCEHTRIVQVFQNLLSNAVKYMDKPEGQIKINCTEQENHWQFSISDNGPGIEEKHFEKIFKIFQTLAPRDEYESTGVGLSVVKKIVEMYSGNIWVTSKVGEGTTFYFTLLKKEAGAQDEKLEAYIAG